MDTPPLLRTRRPAVDSRTACRETELRSHRARPGARRNGADHWVVSLRVESPWRRTGGPPWRAEGSIWARAGTTVRARSCPAHVRAMRTSPSHGDAGTDTIRLHLHAPGLVGVCAFTECRCNASHPA